MWKTPLFPRDALRTVIVHSRSGDSCIWFVNVCFRLTRSLQIYNENNGGNQSHLMVRLEGAKAKAKVTSLLSQVPSGGDRDGYVQGVGMFTGTLLAADI